VRPRRLNEAEIQGLLAAPLVCRLATMDGDGFPRITPLWFIWDNGCFWMTSLNDRQHLVDLRRNPRAALCVDVEQPNPPQSPHRPNQQISARGSARLFADDEGRWTRQITLKYLTGEVGEQHAVARASQARTAICFSPIKLVALGAP
jgi:nitroimidazol reductase NimA-like FMN-containing flavoprotein (pyridoxamine 5'-phosphate oxidase superfamily)